MAFGKVSLTTPISSITSFDTQGHASSRVRLLAKKGFLKEKLEIFALHIAITNKSDTVNFR